MAPRDTRCSAGKRQYRKRSSRVVGRDGCGMTPRRRALEDVQLRGRRRDLGHELDRRRARADHRDPLARQIEAVVPARRVEDAPREALEAGQLRRLGLEQRPGRGDDHTRGHRVSVVGLQRPAPGLLVPLGAGDRAAQADVVAHAERIGAAAQVSADLGPARVGVRPVRVGRERERVEVGRDVAAAARVRVEVPGAADVVAALEHDEVLDALLLEPDRHAEAGEPGADDGDVMGGVHRSFVPCRLRLQRRNLQSCNLSVKCRP